MAAESSADRPADEALPKPAPGTLVRGLLRRAGQASLATRLQHDASGDPYVSLVVMAVDQDAGPLLLLSDLAEHTANLKAEARASLLVDGTAGHEDPLTGPRASLQGSLAPLESPAALERFQRRHPSARFYGGFADFNLYRFNLEKAHLVSGFGDIHWIEAAEILYDCRRAGALAAAEGDIVDHMNQDHGDALALMARHLLHQAGDGWTMTGIDPEGLDLRGPHGPGRGLEGGLQRLDFDGAVGDPEGARAALIALTRRAREAAQAPDSLPGNSQSGED